MNDDPESHIVIGYNKRTAKVARRESELNGTSFNFLEIIILRRAYPPSAVGEIF